MKVFRTLRLWLKWHKKWDSLCNNCGKCCYDRAVNKDGDVIIFYNFPCEHLDTYTKLCKIYDDRLKKCKTCSKVTLRTALYNKTLPKSCPYVQVFRYGKDIDQSPSP